MNLLSIFKRKTDASARPAAGSVDAVQLARTRARRRLIGAAVLVVAGIIGFPLLFETQPRPVAVDVPIDIPRRENAPPLAVPAARPEASRAPEAGPASPKDAALAEPAVIAPRQIVPDAAPPASAIALQPEAAKPKPASAPSAAKPAPKSDGARAEALLEGKPPAAATGAPGAGRFVVQVGAFAEQSAAHETRLKVEALGLKTYTQVAETPAGKRIRVRVGPFASREEADKAAAKVKAAALPSVILAL